MKTQLPNSIVEKIKATYQGNYTFCQVDDKPEVSTGIWYDTVEFDGCTIQFYLCKPTNPSDTIAVHWYLISDKVLPSIVITTKGGCLVGVQADSDMLVRYVDLDEEGVRNPFHPEFVSKLQP